MKPNQLTDPLEAFIIKDFDENNPPKAPGAFLHALCKGKGGIIIINPNTSPQTIIGCLRAISKTLAAAVQWATVKVMTEEGMNKEIAEFHINQALNKMLNCELGPVPSKEEMAATLEREDLSDYFEDESRE